MDVGHSGTEKLDPGQQDELIDEFAACFSEELVLCRVCRIWSLLVFLVCGVVVLSMTACFEYEIVKLITVVWYRYCVIWTVCECIVEEFTDYDSVVVFSDVGRAYNAKFFVISH